MRDKLSSALRASAKGSGWTARRDLLTRRVDNSVLAIHPRRGAPDIFEFRAKPLAWDDLLWSTLQIDGNEKLPASFRFTGAFTCDTPALDHMDFVRTSSPEALASQMLSFARNCHGKPALWKDYDLNDVIAAEPRHEPYRYHQTCVLDRICAGDRQAAQMICSDVLAGALDCRITLSAIDKQMPLDATGRRPSLNFFELAKIWLSRN
ncbi:hypothetical protein [Endobacterium cereale]|uniref:hypothetical protein n=1 Tax=Endobacterium cereale TaxID=2663029 RepID=UPI002B464AE5|nr:hypothetical protein [Endobacterium cereale]MEB2846909.1 hypothetical protein [Endobacterium cereale]